jgi:ferredoxin
MVVLYRCNMHLGAGVVVIYVDETLCTSCGRCVGVCPTGAIVSVEAVDAVPERVSLSPHALVQLGESQPARGRAPSKLDVVEKIVSGLIYFATYALNRRQAGSTDSVNLRYRTGGHVAPTGGRGGGGCPGGRQLRGGGRGMGTGRGCNNKRGDSR